MGYTKAQREAKAKKLVEEKKNETEVVKDVVVSETAAPKTNVRKTAKKIPLDLMIPVVSNTIGGLIYESKKQVGYIVEWGDLGAVEYMELSELQSLRNTARRFFEDAWIIVEDAEYTDDVVYSPTEIYEFLRVDKHYDNNYTPYNIEDIFDNDATGIAREIGSLSNGMKSTVAALAKRKFDEGSLDLNLVSTIEQSLGVQLSV